MMMYLRRLPFLVALVAFVVYACTMGSGLTLTGLLLAAKLTGWDQTPMVGLPVVWLVTLPLQALPALWVPLALKLLAAILAATVMGLLARTVQLLPWDHPWERAGKTAATLPAIAACILCGMEFSFWIEATATCGELLDLLLVIIPIWLLLEYRIRRQFRWLEAAVFVWGLGTAENWVMLLTAPIFGAAVLWLERLRLYDVRSLMRLLWLGLGGFAIYLMLPTVNGLLPHSPWTFAESWLASLRQTKAALLFPLHFWRAHHLLTVAILIPYLVPTLPLLVHMRDEGMQNKYGVDRFQLWLYRALRLGLLLACCWLAFDPLPIGRHMAQKELGMRLPMLTFDYLNALGAAFLLGNFLLASRTVVERDGYYGPPDRLRLKRFVVPLACLGVVLTAAGLGLRNAGTVTQINFHSAEKFGDLAVRSLPAGSGVMVSDAPDRLAAFEASLAHSPAAESWLAVDARLLPAVKYRAQLERRHPGGWLTPQNQHELSPVETVRLLEQVKGTNHLCYLHPGFGPLFEVFRAEPLGVIFELKPRGGDPVAFVPPPAASMADNEQFWTESGNRELADFSQEPERANHAKSKFSRLGVAPPLNEEKRILGEWFSIPLDAWAVTLQKSGHLREAQARFQQALQLNPKNASARINLACNSNLLTSIKMGLADVTKLAEQMGGPERVTILINSCGPMDEPTLDYVTASMFLNHGLPVQAAEQLERVRVLAPDSPAPELALAEIYNQLQMPQRSQPLLNRLRERYKGTPGGSSLDLDLALMESYSWLLQTNAANARTALQTVVRDHPDDPLVANRVISAYLAFSDVTNAMQLLNTRLAKDPNDVPVLNTKAAILMRTGHSDEAVPILNQVLLLTNQPAARINRALARLDLHDFAAAEVDLKELEKSGTAPGMVDLGLAVVSEHHADTNLERHYLQLCLNAAATNTPMWRQANQRLQALAPAPNSK